MNAKRKQRNIISIIQRRTTTIITIKGTKHDNKKRHMQTNAMNPKRNWGNTNNNDDKDTDDDNKKQPQE